MLVCYFIRLFDIYPRGAKIDERVNRIIFFEIMNCGLILMSFIRSSPIRLSTLHRPMH